MDTPEFKELRVAAKAAAFEFRLPTDWQEGRIQAFGDAVDGESTDDRDDAFRILPQTDGTTNVEATFVDPSFIPPDSPIAEYALALGETQYFPQGKSSPMIHPVLSSGRLSLLEGVERPGITVRLSIDQYDRKSDASVVKSVIKAGRKTYNEVAALTHSDDPNDEEAAKWRQYEAFAVHLLKGRRDSGALAYFNADRNILTDEEGRPVFLEEGGEHSGNIIVQEIMILANSALAAYAQRNGIPSLYRRFEWASPVNIQTIGRLIEQGGREQIVDLLKNKGRGFYSSKPGPHDALKVTPYGRYSSTMRRGVDFINLSNISAHKDGKPYPFPQDTLDEWSEKLNTLERTPWSKAGAIYRAEKKAKKHLGADATQLVNLPKAELSHVIEIARERDEMPPAVAEAMSHLLAEGKLPQSYFHRLLIHRTADEGWLELRRQLMPHVVAPGVAKNILLGARASQMLEDLHFEPTVKGPNGFESVVTAHYPDGPFIEKRNTSMDRKAAENGAAIEMLAQLAGIEHVEYESLAQSEVHIEVRNPISLLYEFYQREGGIIRFDTKRVPGSPDHAPVFQTTLTLPDKEPITGVGINKKEAEKAAAAKAVAADNIAERLHPEQSADPAPEKHPISILYEMVQAGRLNQPNFHTERTGGPDHAPIFTSTLVVKTGGEAGDEQVFTGKGPKSRIAETEAAQAAVRALTPKSPQSE